LNKKPGLAFVGQQVLCASDPNGYRILCFNQDGTPRQSWGSFGADSSQVNFPTGLAFDDHQGLWVADTSNGRLLQFTLP